MLEFRKLRKKNQMKIKVNELREKENRRIQNKKIREIQNEGNKMKTKN
jgi:hypothetical protein